MDGIKLLTAAEILAADDTVAEYVEVPEWKGSVRVRGLSAAERIELAKSVTDKDGKAKTEGFQIRLVSMSLCDDKGERLFTDAQVEQLSKKNGLVIDRLFAVAERLSVMAPKQVEDLAGKSGAAPTSSSPSV